MIKIHNCCIKYLRKPANSTSRLSIVETTFGDYGTSLSVFQLFSIISIILCRVSCYVRQARAVFFFILKDLAFLVRSRKYIVLYLNYSFCEFISAITVVKNSSFSKI